MKIFEKGSFSKNVIVLMTGTIIAQAIPLAVSPVLTRLFTPGDFGLFALYFGISQIISVFMTARYEMAIILPEKDEDAVNIVALSIAITILVSLLCLIIILLLRFFIPVQLTNPNILNYMLLMPITILGLGFSTIFSFWLNRKEHYKSISGGKIVRSIFASFFSVGFGLTVLKTGGLIIADTIGQIVSGIYLFLKSLKYDIKLISQVSKQNMLIQAKRYKQFPKYNLLSGFLEKGSGQIPVILLTSFFGSAITGFFSLSQRLIAAPEILISVSIGNVFRQQANIEYLEKGNCVDIFMTLFKLLLKIAIIPFALLFVLAPFLFSFIFGPDWRIAGEYTQIMTIMFFLRFIVSPLSNMFFIAEKQNIDLIIQIILFSFVCLSFFAGYKIFSNPKPAILFYTITYSIKYCIEFYLSYEFSKGLKSTS
jgi:O-antigen/teichoic acid export membrane protein